MKLKETQNLFQDHMVRTNDQIDERFAALYETGKIPLDERVRVYRDNIVSGLAATMAQTFPTVRALCGEEFTRGLLRHYIRQNLPQSGWLEEYGADIPEFIATFPPAKQLPYLADSAKLDWCLSACEHAQDDYALSPKNLQGLERVGDVTLHLRTSAYLLYSPFPILKIRDFSLNPDHEEMSPPDLKGGETYVMIYRPYLKGEYIELSKDEYAFLKHIHGGESVASALEQTIEVFQDFDFNTFFQKFFNYETFRDVKANA